MKKTHLCLWLCSTMLIGCLGGDYIPAHYCSIRAQAVDPCSETLPVALGIRDFQAPSTYNDRIVHRPSLHRLEYLEYERWGDLPADMTTAFFLKSFRDAGLFRHVSAAQNVRGLALILDGELLQFEIVEDSGRQRASCSLFLELRSADEDGILWSREFTCDEPCVLEDKESVAEAMSRAVGRIFGQAVDEIRRAPRVRSWIEESRQDANN
jgi:ABC-type uncharacterized transport system auxiliary subunit